MIALDLLSLQDRVNPKDLTQIHQFDDEGITYYLNDPFTFNKALVIEDNTIIGAGCVRVLNEFKMILNPDLSDYKKAKVLKLLMDEAIKKAQCSEILINVTKDIPRFSQRLITHYNTEIRPGFFLKLER